MGLKRFLLAAGLYFLMFGACAQGVTPEQGRDYVTLNNPQPTSSKKIEVTEFFGYFCSACNQLEPLLERWQATMPVDVVLEHVPVRFAKSLDTQQRIYYTLEVMGLVRKMQRKIFDAVHRDGKRLVKPKQAFALISSLGINEKKFKQIFNSFSVRSRAKAAPQLQQDYQVDGTPTLIVGGKYKTSPVMSGGYARSLKVVDALVVKVRKERDN